MKTIRFHRVKAFRVSNNNIITLIFSSEGSTNRAINNILYAKSGVLITRCKNAISFTLAAAYNISSNEYGLFITIL